MTVTIDDEVARRHDRETRGARQPEPWPAILRPRATVAVAHGLDRLLAERDAHERRLTGPAWWRVALDDTRELMAERWIVQARDQAVRTDGERGRIETARMGAGATRVIDGDREGLIGQRAVDI